MKLKNVALLGAVLLLLVLAYQPVLAGVNVGVSVGLPVVTFAAPPQVAVIPGTYAYFVPDVDADIVFYGGRWHRYWNDRWYFGRGYNGPWVVAGPTFVVPEPLLYVRPGWRNTIVIRERIHYDHFHRHWRTWERDRYWEHKHDWWRKAKDERRRDRHEAREDRRERKEDKRERIEDRRERKEDKRERVEDRRERKEDRAEKRDRKNMKRDGGEGQRGGKNARLDNDGGQRGGKNIRGGGGQGGGMQGQKHKGGGQGGGMQRQKHKGGGQGGGHQGQKHKRDKN